MIAQFNPLLRNFEDKTSKNLYVTGTSGDKSGRVDQRGTLGENDISDKMLKRGTGLTKQEIMGIMDLYNNVELKSRPPPAPKGPLRFFKYLYSLPR